jgi:hypothetical protein
MHSVTRRLEHRATYLYVYIPTEHQLIVYGLRISCKCVRSNLVVNAYPANRHNIQGHISPMFLFKPPKNPSKKGWKKRAYNPMMQVLRLDHWACMWVATD